jgi:hypothetical protein
MRIGSSAPGRLLALVAATTFVGALSLSFAEETAGPPTDDPATETPSPREDCCFTNRAYVGVCVVTPAEEETCATILAYLNNPQSKGRDYCGKTTIRGGWQQTACEAPQAGGPAELDGH